MKRLVSLAYSNYTFYASESSTEETEKQASNTGERLEKLPKDEYLKVHNFEVDKWETNSKMGKKINKQALEKNINIH